MPACLHTYLYNNNYSKICWLNLHNIHKHKHNTDEQAYKMENQQMHTQHISHIIERCKQLIRLEQPEVIVK